MVDNLCCRAQIVSLRARTDAVRARSGPRAARAAEKHARKGPGKAGPLPPYSYQRGLSPPHCLTHGTQTLSTQRFFALTARAPPRKVDSVHFGLLGFVFLFVLEGTHGPRHTPMVESLVEGLKYSYSMILDTWDILPFPMSDYGGFPFKVEGLKYSYSMWGLPYNLRKTVHVPDVFNHGI